MAPGGAHRHKYTSMPSLKLKGPIPHIHLAQDCALQRGYDLGLEDLPPSRAGEPIYGNPRTGWMS
jgi:hypothetical protein